MNTLFRSSFARDLKKIKDRSVLASIRQTILNVEQATDPNAIADLSKLSGQGRYFRIRVGDYRLGLVLDGEAVEFVRCLHRREIYRFFP